MALAFARRAPDRLHRAGGSHSRALRRKHGARLRDARTASAGSAGGGAAAAGGPVSDAGLAARLAGAVAGPAGSCRLAGALAVGTRADSRDARGILHRRDPAAAGAIVVDVGADPRPVVAVARD